MHVLPNGATCEGRRAPLFHRDINGREGIDLDRFSVFENLELARGEIANEVSAFVGHQDIDVDVVDVDLKCRRRRALRPLTFLSGNRAGERNQKQSQPEGRATTHIHGIAAHTENVRRLKFPELYRNRAVWQQRTL